MTGLKIGKAGTQATRLDSCLGKSVGDEVETVPPHRHCTGQ